MNLGNRSLASGGCLLAIALSSFTMAAGCSAGDEAAAGDGTADDGANAAGTTEDGLVESLDGGGAPKCTATHCVGYVRGRTFSCTVTAWTPHPDGSGKLAYAQSDVDCPAAREDSRYYKFTVALQQCVPRNGCWTIPGSTSTEKSMWDLSLGMFSKFVPYSHGAMYRAVACVRIVSGDGVTYDGGGCLYSPVDRMY